MNRITYLSLFIYLMSGMTSIFAELPKFYKEVDHMVWVVEDLGKVTKGWKKIGFTEMEDLDWIQFIEEGENAIRMRAATAYLGGTRILWLEPGKKPSILKEFLTRYGEGVWSLVHAPTSWTEVKLEEERLSEAGMKESLMVRLLTKNGEVRYIFGKTDMQGTYVLGLTDETSAKKLYNPELKGYNKYGLKFSQYAFAVREPGPVSDYWHSLGFPEMEVTPSVVWEPEYYGQAADFKMDLGWQRHGNIVYEWCIPLRSPTVYEDHIKAHGEGFQHMGFRVEDMDEAIEVMESKQLAVSQSGGWGEKGKKGSGRFAYIDTTPYGGLSIELLWSYKE